MRGNGVTLELFPYQDKGAAFIAPKSRVGLLDVPGLGKTAQAVRKNDINKVKRGIIISPAHLRANWIGENDLFSRTQRRIVKVKTIHDFVAWSRGVFDVMCLSYERATSLAPHIHKHGEILDFIDLDEAHYLNNVEAKRTIAILGPDTDGIGGIMQWAEQSTWITGTLMPNDPSQSYTFLKYCGVMPLTQYQFIRRYFHSNQSTYGMRCRPKTDMLPELQSLIENNSIRRTFEDVGVELPEIFLTTTLVDGDTEKVRFLLREHPGLDEAIVSALEQGGLSFLDSQHIATLRRLIAEAKALPYVEMLIEELKADPSMKCVVMGISRNALQMIRDELAKKNIWCILVQGGVKDNVRDEGVKAFQTQDKCRVFIGNMRAAGTGLTLTASANLDILESDWTPAGNDQAIKRIRRIGQMKKQRARFITLANSFDVVVNKIVAEKTRNIALVEGSAMIAVPPKEDAA